MTVVDTPGWMSHSLPPDRVSEELRRGLTLCRQDPHVILLALPCTSTFGQPEWRAMEAQLRLLQTPIWQKAMVLFTRADKLGGLTITVLSLRSLVSLLIGRRGPAPPMRCPLRCRRPPHPGAHKTTGPDPSMAAGAMREPLPGSVGLVGVAALGAL